MSIQSQLRSGFNRLIELNGTQICVRYYSMIYGDTFDDDVSLVQSGVNLWTSGIILTANIPTSTSEGLLVEQGKWLPDDKRLYVNGSLSFVSNNLTSKVGFGSPCYDFYSLIPLGVQEQQNQDEAIYRKVYVRRLTNGSLIGE